jgi:hypothetical protein
VTTPPRTLPQQPGAAAGRRQGDSSAIYQSHPPARNHSHKGRVDGREAVAKFHESGQVKRKVSLAPEEDRTITVTGVAGM